MEEIKVKEENGKIWCPLKNAYHVSTPEERVRQIWVCKLVNEYGYSLEQMAQEVSVTTSKKSSPLKNLILFFQKTKIR